MDVAWRLARLSLTRRNEAFAGISAGSGQPVVSVILQLINRRLEGPEVSLTEMEWHVRRFLQFPVTFSLSNTLLVQHKILEVLVTQVIPCSS